jgi:PKHD-type hydroxylase
MSFWYLSSNDNSIDTWYKDAFTNEELDSIVEMGNKCNVQKASVGTKVDYTLAVDKNQRITDVAWLYVSNESAWIYRKLTEVILYMNKTFYNYDLSHIETLQYTIYNKGFFYKQHIDSSTKSFGYPRKLSFITQLSDPSDYDGGEVMIHTSSEPYSISKERGTIILFPSDTLHQVTPITRGVRKSLVGWVHGPDWR